MGHFSGRTSPKWRILCRVGRKTLLHPSIYDSTTVRPGLDLRSLENTNRKSDLASWMETESTCGHTSSSGWRMSLLPLWVDYVSTGYVDTRCGLGIRVQNDSSFCAALVDSLRWVARCRCLWLGNIDVMLADAAGVSLFLLQEKVSPRRRKFNGRNFPRGAHR